MKFSRRIGRVTLKCTSVYYVENMLLRVEASSICLSTVDILFTAAVNFLHAVTLIADSSVLFKAVVCRASFLAETSVSSTQKTFIFIIYKNRFLDQSNRKICNLILNTEPMVVCSDLVLLIHARKAM